MKKIKKPFLLIIIGLVIASMLGACTSNIPALTPTGTENATNAVTPALDLQSDGSPFVVYQGGYSFEAPLGSDVNIIGPSTTISAEGDSLLFKMDGLNSLSVTRSAQESWIYC